MIQEKAKVLKAIRDYFDKTGAIEVITNILQEYPNLDSNIYPLKVKAADQTGLEKEFFLHTSPEFAMKKLVSRYKKDIYQITKVFRNFEGSKKHRIEFTMLEWYRLNSNLDDLMDDTQNIFMETAISLYKKPVVYFNGKTFDFRKVEKISVNEAFHKFTNTYPDDYNSMLSFLRAKENLKKDIDYKEAFFRIYAFYVEPNLGKENLTFIYDYPPEFAALAKVEKGRGKRFEAYVDGIELVNGYYELTDTKELERVLTQDAKEKYKETGEVFQIDYEFIDSMKNIPDFSGASLGIERLFMILLNKQDIKEVLDFELFR